MGLITGPQVLRLQTNLQRATMLSVVVRSSQSELHHGIRNLKAAQKVISRDLPSLPQPMCPKVKASPNKVRRHLVSQSLVVSLNLADSPGLVSLNPVISLNLVVSLSLVISLNLVISLSLVGSLKLASPHQINLRQVQMHQQTQASKVLQMGRTIRTFDPR